MALLELEDWLVSSMEDDGFYLLLGLTKDYKIVIRCLSCMTKQ